MAMTIKLAAMTTRPTMLMVSLLVASEILAFSPPAEIYVKPPLKNCQRVKRPAMMIKARIMMLMKLPV